MLLYFTTTRLHIVIFLKIWPFQSTLFFRHGPICNAKKLNFRFSTIFFSTSQTLSYATVSGSRFLNEYIKLQICGNCLHVENLSSSTLFIITLFEIRIDVRICCWLLWLWNISWHCWNFECILMEKLFWWCNKESGKNQMLSKTKTNVYRLVFS